MAQYKVLTQSWIGDRLRQAGEIIDFTGEPGSNLELIEAEKPAPKGKKAQAEAPAGDESVI